MKRKILYTTSFILLTLFCLLLGDYVIYLRNQDAKIVADGKESSLELRSQVNEILQNTMEEAQILADSLTCRTYSRTQLEQLIQQRSLEVNAVLGITVGYEPYAFDKHTKLYAPYYDKNKNKIIKIEKLYDYTDNSLAEANWYTSVVNRNKSFWVEPYYAKGAKALVADFGIPFYFSEGPNKGKVRGTVTMTISLRSFRNLVHKLSLGRASFGFVSSEGGVLLAHPDESLIGNKSLDDLANDDIPTEFSKAILDLKAGNSGMVQFLNDRTKEEQFFYYDKVLATNWGIGVVYFKSDMETVSEELKRKYIHLALILGFLLFTLLAIYFVRDYLSTTEIWYLSHFSTLVLLLLLILIGYLQHNFSNKGVEGKGLSMVAITDVNQFVDIQNEKEEKLNRSQFQAVPTGIYIQELEFLDTYNINISGIVWQRFDTITFNKITPGFTLPQTAPFAEASYVEEKSRHYYHDKVLIHYDVRSTLRLPFNYGNFPFDKRNVSIKIQPVNFEDKLLLVPDLGSYDNTTPSRKVGINKEIQLSGEKIQEAFFSVNLKKFTTDFGYMPRDYFNSVPILQYNIKIKRTLITAFITYLIPVFVTLIMIFILIKATQKPLDLHNSEGGGIVQGMAAFFFVLIFSHIDLRKDILTGSLIYMEYFYFISYAMIILATHNLITYTRLEHRVFDYRDNIIVKAVFWPTYLLLILVLTLYKFY